MKRKFLNTKKSSNNLITLFFAIFLTAGVTLLLSSLSLKSLKQKQKEQPIVVAEYDTINIPVPDAPVPAGTLVKNISFRQVPYPKHQLSKGVITDLTQFYSAQTIAVLPAQLPLFPENFTFTTNIKNPILDQIPSGMRAMTLKVDATSSVEGWAGSGTVVDVLLVTPERTSVIAERVKILSSERSTEPVEGNSSPNIPTTATILVTQEQCLAINTSIPLGKIAFALRSNGDEELWTTTTYTKDLLKGGAIPVVSSNTSNNINGFITVKNSNNSNPQDKKQYALRNGKWIKTEVVPEGFFE